MQNHRIVLALAGAMLLCGLGFPTSHGSLAAYTETRSFRDALDGRSMEEAMSGPVDRDTSSYGERTGGGSLSGMGPNSGRGMQAASMMLNIPANGNLMGANEQQQQQQQEEQQQQKTSTGGSELERETSTAAEDSAMDSQQKMVEPSSQMQTAYMMEMRARQQQQQQKMMLMKNAAQQQLEQDSTTESSQSGAAKGQAEQGFGEDQSMGAQAKGGPKRSQEQASKTPMGADTQKYNRDEQQKQMGDSNGSQDEQQVVTLGGKVGGTEMSAELLAKQKMIAMLMSMSKAMNYQGSMTPASGMQSSQAAGYGDPMNMGAPAKGSMKKMKADNMLMAMVNMKSMMNSPAMASMMTEAAAYKPASQAADYNGYSNRRGAMRRANQRKLTTRKMSPAMVNTLLNKMMNSSTNKQSYSTGSMQSAPKPDALAMLMRSAAGAELLTNMVASQSPMMSEASPVARDQYKRMMMAAIMKQAAAASNGASMNSYGSGANGMGASYSAADTSGRQDQSMTARQNQKPSTKSAARGYAPATGASAAPAMSPLAIMMNLMNAQRQMSNPMGQMEQQQQDQQTSITEPPSYSSTLARSAGSKRSKTSAGGSMMLPQPMEQQVMMSPASAQSGFGDDTMMTPPTTKSSSARQMPSRLAMMMSNGAAARGASMANRYASSMKSSINQQTSGDNAQQKYKDQSYLSMGEMDQQQQQQQQQTSLDMPTKSSMKEADSPMLPTMASVPRPAMPTASMVANDMRPMMSYQAASAKPSGGAKGDQQQQQKDDFEQNNSYGNGANDNDSQQQQQQLADNAGNLPEEQVKGQQQVDENGAAPKGMAEPFAFDYKVEDDYGNEHYRKEESDKNGAVRGSYGYMDNNGLYRHVEYVADENGFRANVKSNEPGLSSDSPKLSPATGGGSTMGGSQQMARPAQMGSPAQESSGSGNSQMMSQMLDMAQMLAANDGNQQQQIPASQTELSAEESRRRRA